MVNALLYHLAHDDLHKLSREDLLRSAPTDDQSREKRQSSDGSTFHKGVPQCRAQEFMWVDVIDPDEDDFRLLAERFKLHPMILEDIQGREGRPKLHDYDEYLYIIFHAIGLRVDETNVDLHEIDCLVGPDYVVTIHHGTLQPFEDLRARWQAHPQLMQTGPAYLLYELMDEVLDDYFPALDALDEKIDGIEDRLFNPNSNGNHHITADIFALKRNLTRVRQVAGPTRDVINILLRRDAESGGKHFAYFQDLYDHAVRILDTTDTFRDVLGGALDAYLAVESNRMNAIMKTLTSASIILFVPNLIAAIYGMNFKNMPETQTPYGYFVALAIMSTFMVGLALNFKRKGWL